MPLTTESFCSVLILSVALSPSDVRGACTFQEQGIAALVSLFGM